MNRRHFIGATLLAVPALAPETAAQSLKKSKSLVMTVRGPIDAQRLGSTLMHEHVMVDFVGADQVSPQRYQRAEVFTVALPHLKRVAGLGCQTIVDCTPAYLGRDVLLLKQLSAAANINLITNTGYYGAAEDKFVPRAAYQSTAAELAAIWTREFVEGIDGTQVKPGFIKIGVDSGPLSTIDRKLIEAAALTHLRTGLTIGSHTGDGVAAMEQLDVIEKLGVSPAAFVWIHAQSEKDETLHRRAAERGCWVEFDGVSDTSLDEHLAAVKRLARQGHLDRVLISMDAGWYHVGEPNGGKYRGYEVLFTEFLPRIKKDLGERGINQLTVENPRRALAIAKRPKS